MTYGQTSRAVTPDDNNDIDVAVRPSGWLFVGAAGDLTVTMENGIDQLFPNVPIGFHPIHATRVKSTGTTAGSIVALKG